MTPPNCERAWELLDLELTGELGAAEQRELQAHLDECDRCSEFAQAWSHLAAGLAEAEPQPLPALVARRVAVDAANLKRPAGRPRSLGRVLVPLAAAAAILLALGGWWLAAGPAPEPDADQGSPAALVRAPSTPEERGAAAHPAREGSSLRMIREADGRRLLEAFEGSGLWVAVGARVEQATVLPGEARFSVVSGWVVAEVGPSEPGHRFVVETPSCEVEARGTLFAVEVTADGAEWVRVVEGLVEVRQRGAHVSHVLGAGEQVRVGGSGVGPADPEDLKRDRCLAQGCVDDAAERTGQRVATGAGAADAGVRSATDSIVEQARAAIEEQRLTEAAGMVEQLSRQAPRAAVTRDLLLKLARAYRRAKLFRPAADTYRRLIAGFPGTSAANSALIALGQVELNALGQPELALSRFDTYLEQAPAGYLAEEARAGRVRSLGRMGRVAETRRAATDYLKVHPNGFSAAEMLRRRGDALRKLGDCAGACVDYRRVTGRWPGSTEAERATAGLAACGQQP